ncbi:MAG: T9SS type A sorting domain-containing protein [Ignavibacteria bacterium]|jgi:hypothetical protein
MKKNLTIFLIIIITSNFTFSGTYSGGSGTSGSPYQIATTDDLIELSTTSGDWSAYFIQTADITFNADETLVDWDDDGSADGSGTEGFSPVGNSIDNYFKGSYDGNGYKITNLYINRPDDNYVGFFGMVYPYSSPGSLSNIVMENVDITGYSCVGGIAGRMTGTIENCYVIDGNVSGYSIVGGLFGYNNNQSTSSISKCFSGADVSGTSDAIGGLIGSTVEPPSECYSTGNVSGVRNTGGLIGNIYIYSSDTEILSNCYSLGDVTRSSGTYTSFGAFIGYVNINKEEEFGEEEVGDLTIENCYSIGNVNCGSETDKGFVGELYSDGGTPTYTNNFFDSQVSNQSTATGATAKTTTQMKTQSTFTDWDFTNVWQIVGGDGANYPDLRENSNSALPVELTGFTASVVEEGVKLNWQTATEINNYGFQVQRNTPLEGEMSETRGVWKTIGFINGNGNSSSPKSYSYIDTPTGGTSFTYRLKQIDFDGAYEYSDEVEVSLEAITEYNLDQNYPNPFNPTTTINYQIPETGNVTLKVYDVLGREVKTLVNETQKAGIYEVGFNASNLASGIYIYRLQAGEFTSIKKLMLMK